MTHPKFFTALLIGFLPIGSVFFARVAAAQNTSEVGLGIGGLTYKGELSPSYQFRNNRPALTAFYRKDVSAPITLRAGLTAGMLRAADESVRDINNRNEPLAAYRQANMKGSLLEASGVIEYNFFDYHDRHDKIHLTPYVFVGLAGFYAHTTTQGQGVTNSKYQNLLGIAIPAGVGIKYALSEHWNLGLEAGARKAFTDKLDGYNGSDLPAGSGAKLTNELLGNSHDQDWYFYNGLSISYTFYKIRCPDESQGKRSKK